ncbi:MAG: glutathione S-transferase family protein [Gammaproteobacteria bacterium]
MTSMRLYSAPSCPFAQRSRLLLFEKGVEYEQIDIDLKTTPAWFLEISPAGKVPCLEHDGEVILESAVINEYLDEIYPVPGFLPTNPVARARCRYAIARLDQALIPAFYKLLLEQDPQRRERPRQRLYAAFSELAPICTGPWFMGEQLTLMDLAVYPFFERLAMLDHYRGIELPAAAQKLEGWHQRMLDLPSVQTLFRPPEFYIEAYSHYADGSADGITAREMRET